MTFGISQDKVVTADRWCGYVNQPWVSNFLRISHT